MDFRKLKVAAAIVVLYTVLAINPVHAASSCDIKVQKETSNICECVQSNKYWIGVDKKPKDSCLQACSKAAGCK